MDRRRRLGCLIALAVVLLLTGVGWWLLPRLVCAIVNASLPHEIDQQTTLLSLDPDCDRLPPPAILLQVEPSLLRRIGADASHRWIPPGLIRHGLGALGSLRGDGGISVAWRAEAAAGAVPPRLAVALTPAEADALIAASGGTTTVGGFTMAPHLASLELAEVSAPTGPRRFHVEATGALHLDAGTLHYEVPVRRLIGTLEVAFTPDVAGWEVTMQVTIGELQAPLPTLPGLDAAAWRRLIADAIQRRISDRLEGRRLPTWFPRDLRVSAVVR